MEYFFGAQASHVQADACQTARGSARHGQEPATNDKKWLFL
jgi:hypothetical protein